MDKNHISIDIMLSALLNRWLVQLIVVIIAVIIIIVALIVVAREERIKRLLRLAESHVVIGDCFVCSTPTSQRCRRCKVARYCSRKCQIIHWTQGHEYECRQTNEAADDQEIVVNEHKQALRVLEEERELVKLLKIECEEIRQSFMRQVKKKELELVNALNAAFIAEAKLTDYEKKIKLSEDKSERAKARRELLEEQKRVRRLKLKVQEIERNSMRKVEEARVAERRRQEKHIQMLDTECVRLRRELEQGRMQRLQLEQDDGLQRAKRKAERLSQKLANSRKRVEFAENGWMKALRELEEERELVRRLKMECEEIRQSSIRQMEEKELDLANALNAAAAAAAEACAICLTNEKDVAFGCGHMTCGECMLTISNCHICREPITSRLRLFRG